MKIDRNTAVFFDASCLIAASGSPSGGSGFLLSLCAKGFLQGVVSQPVLIEAQRNITSKLGSEALNTFFRLLAVVPLTLTQIPAGSELKVYETLVNPKDAHVVAAAEVNQVPFILTLDKRLAAQINQTNLPVKALTPGEFIKSILIHHTDYPSDH